MDTSIGARNSESSRVKCKRRRAQKKKLRLLARTAHQNKGPQNEHHVHPGGGASTQSNAPQGDVAQDDTSKRTPMFETYGLLRILPTVNIFAGSDILVRNPRSAGPQVDICAQVPGRPNTWAARISCKDSFADLDDLITESSGLKDVDIRYYRFDSVPAYDILQRNPLAVPVGDSPHSFIALVDEEEDSVYGVEPLDECGNLELVLSLLGEEGSDMVI